MMCTLQRPGESITRRSDRSRRSRSDSRTALRDRPRQARNKRRRSASPSASSDEGSSTGSDLSDHGDMPWVRDRPVLSAIPPRLQLTLDLSGRYAWHRRALRKLSRSPTSFSPSITVEGHHRHDRMSRAPSILVRASSYPYQTPLLAPGRR